MDQKKKILVITGVPGTGKTFFSNILKRKIKNSEVIHVTEIVNKKKSFSSRKREGSKIVKMKLLKAELERLIKGSKKQVIILESHLLCDIKIKNAIVVVLREHLSVIKDRLIGRGYRKEKMEANLISEATDYCGIRASNNYPYVFEAFARNKRLIPNILLMLKGGKPKNKDIDLLPELSELIKTGRGPTL